MERFLYRLSISQYAQRFFLKGGLLLRVWDSNSHRATMDIDLLAKMSNQIDNIQKLIKEVSGIRCDVDAVFFDTNNLIIRRAQTAGDYDGVSCTFFAKLFKTKVPILIDIGFNDLIFPKPKKIRYQRF